jgi:hypothetical protein
MGKEGPAQFLVLFMKRSSAGKDPLETLSSKMLLFTMDNQKGIC